jgi:hypothetical protein
MTPDAIERRTFAIADWGYDRGEVHTFLVEMAALLRAAQQGAAEAAGAGVTGAERRDAARALRAEALELAEDGVVDPARLSEQISRILDAADAVAAGLRADAEQALLVARSNAEQEAADRMREAESDAETIREQAKRVLVSSQDQAERIVAEAEAHAESLRLAADERAKIRNQRLQRVADQHAERVLRFEHDAISRLRQAQADLQQAIERLTGSESSPVLDLSGGQPSVRVGSIERRSGRRTVPPVRPRVAERSTQRTSDAPDADPVNRLVRAAVDRAVEHAGREPRVAAPVDVSEPSTTPEDPAEPSPADSSV